MIGSWPRGRSRDDDIDRDLAKRRGSALSESADEIELTAVQACLRDSAYTSLKLRHIPPRSNRFAERISRVIHGDQHVFIGLGSVSAIKRSLAIEIEISDLVRRVHHDSGPG